jgi:WYL domain
MGAPEIPQHAQIPHDPDEIAIRTRVLPMSLPVRARSTLEIIRFAAANHLCVDLTYDGSVRRIEAYLLRQTNDGKFLLYAIRSDSGAHRSYRVDRMQGAAVTSQVFSPRYLVELTSTGPLNVPSFTPNTLYISRTQRPASPGKQGPTYVYHALSAGKRSTVKT